MNGWTKDIRWLTTCWNDTCTAFLTVQESQEHHYYKWFACVCAIQFARSSDQTSRPNDQNERPCDRMRLWNIFSLLLRFNGVQPKQNKNKTEKIIIEQNKEKKRRRIKIDVYWPAIWKTKQMLISLISILKQARTSEYEREGEKIHEKQNRIASYLRCAQQLEFVIIFQHGKKQQKRFSRLIVTIKRQFRLLCLYKFSYKFCIRETRILIHRIGGKKGSIQLLLLLLFFVCVVLREMANQPKQIPNSKQANHWSKWTDERSCSNRKKKKEKNTCAHT